MHDENYFTESQIKRVQLDVLDEKAKSHLLIAEYYKTLGNIVRTLKADPELDQHLSFVLLDSDEGTTQKYSFPTSSGKQGIRDLWDELLTALKNLETTEMHNVITWPEP